MVVMRQRVEVIHRIDPRLDCIMSGILREEHNVIVLDLRMQMSKRKRYRDMVIAEGVVEDRDIVIDQRNGDMEVCQDPQVLPVHAHDQGVDADRIDPRNESIIREEDDQHLQMIKLQRPSCPIMRKQNQDPVLLCKSV